VDWFRIFAQGGASILYVGNSAIDGNECKDEECQLELLNEHCALPLSWYSEMAKEYDCHASLEVNHNGKDTRFEVVGHLPFSSSPIPGDTEKMAAIRENRPVRYPIEMDQAKIDETVWKYANACYNMKRAGMDIALLHGGHGNLLAQFTSTHYNKRTDKYGGSLENRARFAVEVVEKVREMCGPNFVIDYRISADEIIEDGMHFEETLKLMRILRDHGVDMFNVSAGLHSEGGMRFMSYWLQGYTQARAFNAHWCEKIKDHFQGDIRLTAVGSINNIDLAEEIVGKGWADFVAMCRPLMADPEIPRKAAHNRAEDIRPCLRCNACAQRLGGSGPNGPKEMNCAINPFLGLTRLIKDGQVPLAREKKKCAVIGGGVAGLTAMFTLIERGHDVTLYEKTGEVGGQIIPAAAPPIKIDMKDYLKYLQVQTEKVIKAGKAKVLLNTEATPEMLNREGYDSVIIAVGADPIVPKSIPGIDRANVMWAADAETKLKSKVGNKIVVIGAGDVGMEAALDFAEDGKSVEIIDMMEPGGFGGFSPLGGMLREKGIEVKWGTSLVEVTDSGIVAKSKSGETVNIAADSVLLAMGMRVNEPLVESFRRCAPETEVFVVGDAKAVGGNITMAVNPAFQAALHI
jgi:2,4-dienoyl-CoA reductase-like NADH-dependent reductase (Old Yellow Enzyme family)/thioredoxin reductase